MRSRPFASLVLLYGTDPSFLCPFVVVCLQYGERSRTSTSKARHRRGLSRDTPSTSSIVSFLSMEELRSYC